MPNDNSQVTDGMVVGLDYTVHLDNGAEVDSSNDGETLEILQGRGQIVEGLEQALYGMAVGDEKHVVVAPADGYGARDPNALEAVPRNVFPPDLELKLGMRLNLRDRSGEVLTAYLAEIRPDDLLLDFNHPLAGQTLHFDVKITDLRLATSEELSQGHPHDEE